MKYIEIDWILILAVIIACVASYFIIMRTYEDKHISGDEFKIIFEHFYDEDEQ